MRKLLFVSVLLGSPGALSGQGNLGCVSVADPYAHVYRDGYGGMVSLTDSASATQRANLRLPNIPDAQVTIVSDTTTCRIASAAYDAAVGVSAASEAPLVLQLGSQYVVVKRLKFPRGRVNVLFDQAFTTPQKQIWF
jgi:hypothetical protein